MRALAPRVRVALLLAVAAVAAIAAAVAIVAGGGGATTSAPAARPRLDLSTTGGRPAAFLAGIRLSALTPNTAVDGIRAIDTPLFDTPEEASRLVHDADLVVGFEHAGDARAYPVDLLSVHEVVNDVVGGLPVAVTWCPLCQSAVVVERKVGGQTLVFGVSGYLLHENQVLFDRQTGSLWSQLAGGAITGRMRGTRLETLPASVQPWSAWRAEHPGTRVLSIGKDTQARRFEHPFEIPTDRGPELSSEPYGPYLAKVPTYYRQVVRGVQDAEPVLGVIVGSQAKAYPRVSLLRGPANDDVAGTPVLVVRDPAGDSLAAFQRRVHGRTLTFETRRDGALVDRETGSRWSPATGKALAGTLRGTELPRLATATSFWFAWRKLRPEAPVYLPSR